MREKLSYFLYNKEKKKTRKYRKKVKRELRDIRNRNKRLIQKYPWLRVPNWKKSWKDKKCEIVFLEDPYYISLWGEVPSGWTNIFGRMMCDEIEKALEKTGIQDKVYIEQAKEKYGGLRLYMSGNTESQHIISIYEYISEHICCKCGRPHTPMLSLSWVSPYCEKCFNKKMALHYTKSYKELAPENKEEWKIPNEITRIHFSKDGNIKEVEDISERVKNIERLWNKRHPDDMV